MKNIITLIIFALLVFSCEDDLDLQPISQEGFEDAYDSAEDIEQAVIGTYDALQEIYSQMYFFMEIRADNAEMEDLTINAGELAEFELFRLFPNNDVLNETWIASYQGIQRCNILLNRIGDIQMDENLKAVRTAEVKFIRALIYFNAVRIWGDVPLIVREVEDPFDAFQDTRASSEEVYAQIINDLQDAVADLPSKEAQTDIGRATKGAAYALLGKVYLTRAEYANAIENLRAVTGYMLLDDYAAVFATSNENNEESIFEIQYTSGGIGEGSIFPNRFANFNSGEELGIPGFTAGENVPTQEFIESFAAEDKRLNMIGYTTDGRPHTLKFVESILVAEDSDKNLIVIRYADVLLMLAEALNEQAYKADGEAFMLLNQVRSRAGVSDITSTEAPDQNSFRLIIETERKHELAFENHRWFDLVRTGRALEVMNNHNPSTGDFTVSQHQLLFPLPQPQIDASAGKLTQNTGY